MISLKEHWNTALPAYLKIACSYFFLSSAPALTVVFARTLMDGLLRKRWVLNRAGVALAIVFVGMFFLLALLTAVGADLWRNSQAERPTVIWNSALLWRNFAYCGSMFSLVATFLSYRQGVWLSVFFAAFSIASAAIARKCF